MGDFESKRQPIAKGAYQVFASNLTATLFLALASVLVGRLLGPDGFGLYTLAHVAPAYAYPIASLGIPSALTRFAAKYRAEGSQQKAQSFIYSMTILGLLVSLGVVALMLPLSNFLAVQLFKRPVLGAIIPIALISVLGQSLHNNSVSAFQGLERMDRFALLQILQAVSKLALQIILVLAGFSVLGAVLGNTISYFVPAILAFSMIAIMYGRLLPTNWTSDVRDALRYSSPLFLGGVVASLVGPFQYTILASFATNSVVGGYGAAINLSTLITLFVFPISIVLFPTFSRLAADPKRLIEAYGASVRYSGLFIVPITVLTISLSSPAVSAVYGRAYNFAGGFLALMVLPYLLASVGSISQGYLLSGIGKTKMVMLASLAGSLASIGTTPFLALYFGVYGLIIASIVGQVLAFLISWRMVSQTLRSNVELPEVWRLYAASAIGALVAFPVSLLPLHPVLIALLGAGVFIVVLIPAMVWTKAVTRSDLLFLQSNFKGVKPFSYFIGFIARYFALFMSK